MAKENQLKMIKMKGYKGYVWEGFKKIAQEYDKVKWGEWCKTQRGDRNSVQENVQVLNL
jgi:hypothetical protein